MPHSDSTALGSSHCPTKADAQGPHDLELLQLVVHLWPHRILLHEAGDIHGDGSKLKTYHTDHTDTNHHTGLSGDIHWLRFWCSTGWISSFDTYPDAAQQITSLHCRAESEANSLLASLGVLFSGKLESQCSVKCQKIFAKMRQTPASPRAGWTQRMIQERAAGWWLIHQMQKHVGNRADLTERKTQRDVLKPHETTNQTVLKPHGCLQTALRFRPMFEGVTLFHGLGTLKIGKKMSHSNYIGLLYICTYSVHISTACLVVARLCSTLLPSSKAKQSFLQLRLLPQGPSSWEQISSPGVAAKSHESACSCTHAPAGWAVWDGPDL